MDSHQIETAMLREPLCRDTFVGVFASDAIPEKQFPGAYIVNTDPSDQPGQHWVAFYCTENGDFEAFDSFGSDPGLYSESIKAWMGETYTIRSQAVLQSDDSTLCGNYCLYFLLLRCHGISYEDLLSVFCSDRALSDRFVCKFINKYFKLRTTVQDSTFIIKALIKNGKRKIL